MTVAPLRSCIYRGRVRHVRTGPRPHEFSYSLFLVMLDLDELPFVFRGKWLWSAGRPNVASFRREDHMGDPAAGLATAVKDAVERETGRRPGGRVSIVTNLRYWGFVFNPVSFYFCRDADDTRVEAIVAEVNNTPWGERHPYVLHDGIRDLAAPGHRYRFAKAFHVSPFLPMELDYVWTFSEPGDTLRVRMDVNSRGNSGGAGTALVADLAMERRPLTSASLAGALCAHPFMTGKVVAGIYWNALRLWMKRTPFFAHPRTYAAEGRP